MRSPTELTEAFRSRGLTITPQRQAIFRILHENEEHPTAEVVYATVVTEMPSISLRTVYQTLNDLAEMGELQALDLGTGSVRFDPNVDEHHHVVCDRCGRVVDVDCDVSGLGRPALDGFAVERTQVIFRGRCAPCAGRSWSHQQTRTRENHLMAHLKGSKTEGNLKEAFAGESQANRRYLYFAQKADVEGYPTPPPSSARSPRGRPVTPSSTSTSSPPSRSRHRCAGRPHRGQPPIGHHR